MSLLILCHVVVTLLTFCTFQCDSCTHNFHPVSYTHLDVYKRQSLNNVHMQLSGMEQHLNAAIWFVDSDGTMITSAQSDDFPSAPYNVVDFNPAESGNEQYQIGDYHGYFNEDVITVIAPVIYDYSPKGYLLIHQSTDDIYELPDILMHSAYITLGVIFTLSFVILLAFQFFVYRPLSKITEAAKQYASGNLEYEIPVNTEDEMGYLSALSLIHI